MHKEFSNKAMQYLKDNLSQRDCEVLIDNCDNKCIFHGVIFLNNKNFNLELIE